MSDFRRGIAGHHSSGPQTVDQTPAAPVGRVFTGIVGHVPDSHAEVLDANGVSYETRRQGLVTAGGEPIRRGLAGQSIEDRIGAKKQAEEGEELCTRCGLVRQKKDFRTLLKAEGSDNQIRICGFCVRQSHKEGSEQWKPRAQDVRFREDGRAYDGINVNPQQLVTGDTYHQPNLKDAVEPSLGRHTAPRIGKTFW